MPTGGTLTVVNANSVSGLNVPDKFTVRTSKNLVITNYRQRGMGEAGDVCAVVRDGKQGKTTRVHQDGVGRSSGLATLDLRHKRYGIFNALRGLDGNPNDITEADLANANKLIGKLGVKSVKRDANAGVTTIFCDDGGVLRFDFELDSERK